jgi:hypothetical protein
VRHKAGLSPGTAAVNHGRITCSRMEKTAHSVARGSRLESDLCHHDPISPFVRSIEDVWAVKSDRNRGPIELDRSTDPIFPKPVLHLRRLLHPRTSSGGVLRNQAGRGITWTIHSPGNGTDKVITAKTSSINSVISNQNGRGTPVGGATSFWFFGDGRTRVLALIWSELSAIGRCAP